MWWLLHRQLDDAIDDLGCLVGPLVVIAGSITGVLVLVEALLGHGVPRLLAILTIVVAGAVTVYDKLA